MKSVRRGVNVVGYHQRALGLGAEARRVSAALEAVGVPVVRVEASMSSSPTLGSTEASTNSDLFDQTIFVVAADQLTNELLRLGMHRFITHRRIGFWYWELEELTPTMRRALLHVDEIWAGSRWVADVFRRETDTPVYEVPATRPVIPEGFVGRRELGLPDDKTIFLTSFDFFSVVERKNPVAVVRAFREAFPTPGDSLLVVKTQNGERMAEDFDRLRTEVGGRADIILVDRHVDEVTMFSYLRAADIFVSLHRSEGLGLHLLEAAALGKPVIYTDYSAPTQFFDVTNACPVDYVRIPVQKGNGVYPRGAMWADAEIPHAATWMRLLASDADRRTSIGQAAKKMIDSLPGDHELGHALAAHLSVGGM